MFNTKFYEKLKKGLVRMYFEKPAKGFRSHVHNFGDSIKIDTFWKSVIV